jgi:hypothetical protein
MQLFFARSNAELEPDAPSRSSSTSERAESAPVLSIAQLFTPSNGATARRHVRQGRPLAASTKTPGMPAAPAASVGSQSLRQHHIHIVCGATISRYLRGSQQERPAARPNE